MRLEAADGIARALLYEGYVLYPYRPSAVKNQRRWTFGSLLPQSYTSQHATRDRDGIVSECLIEGGDPSVEVRLRFLHVTRRTVLELAQPAQDLDLEALPAHRRVQALQLGREQVRSWEEAVERELSLEPMRAHDLASEPRELTRELTSERELEPLRPRPGAPIVGAFLRERSPLRCVVRVAATRLGEGLWRVRIEARNHSPWTDPQAERPRESALQQALVSTHVLLGVSDGAFASLLEPPPELAGAAAACENDGVWPVLVGPQGARDTLLASPIILYDHPQIAPQSPGDLFDATEIDEILTLRIQTLTPEERREAAASDPLTRSMLERAERLAPERLDALHGGVFRPREGIRPGARVRLLPRASADAFDLILRGQTAVVEALEQDAEGRVYAAVSIDADPGRDLGARGVPGHRFFYFLDELELLDPEEAVP